MRKCPKCSAVYGEPLNFCLVCDAMLETVVEEPLRAPENNTKAEKPEPTSHPAPDVNTAPHKRPSTHFGDLVHAAIEELKDCVLDSPTAVHAARLANSELTLLNLRGRSTAPAMPGDQCPKCGSTKRIPNVSIRGQGPQRAGELLLYLDAAPDASPAIESSNAPLLADVCGDCGHVELKIQTPDYLYKRYLQSKKSQ